MAIRAEYIWIDGTVPLPYVRSKTKIISDSENLPIWGFDGSSTNQAPGDNSDCVLRPVFSCPDPIRGGGDVTLLTDGREIYARTSKGEFFNLLRAPAQPLLVLGDGEGLKELSTRARRAKKRSATKRAKAKATQKAKPRQA